MIAKSQKKFVIIFQCHFSSVLFLLIPKNMANRKIKEFPEVEKFPLSLSMKNPKIRDPLLYFKSYENINMAKNHFSPAAR